MKWKMNVGLSILLLIYILLGALIFTALEFKEYTPPDIREMDFYKEFLDSHPNVTARELEAFSWRVLRAYREEEGVVGNVSEKDNGWTYDNAIYFTITVVSTIGYGHITPETNGGKAFCIFFALAGIPLAMALLASVGNRLRRPIDRLHNARPWYRKDPVRDKQLKSAVVLTVGTVLMLCVPALVFMYTESWDYLTALYYTTVTLTTVGFGDYVAALGSGSESALFRILMCVWLVIGLAYLATVISEASQLYARARAKEEESDRDPDELEELSDNHTPEPESQPTEHPPSEQNGGPKEEREAPAE